MSDTDVAATVEAVEPIDVSLAPSAQVAVMEALAYDAGVLLGNTISQWVNTGEIAQNHRILMGPAGTVALVAICVRTLPPHMLGGNGNA